MKTFIISTLILIILTVILLGTLVEKPVTLFLIFGCIGASFISGLTAKKFFEGFIESAFISGS